MAATPHQEGPRRVHPRLRVHAEAVAEQLVTFMQDVIERRFGFSRVVLGLSGGVDSAVVAALAARAIGPSNVLALQLPYAELAVETTSKADLVVEALGLTSRTIDITATVDALEAALGGVDWHRRGNLQARVRMSVLMDALTSEGAFPLSTTNRSERLLGYYTQGGDDVPQLNPIGELYKTQVWQLAEVLGLPRSVIDQAPSAGLEPGQTDEGDFGLPYSVIDLILTHLDGGFSDDEIKAQGVTSEQITSVRARVSAALRKRAGALIPHLPRARGI